MLVRYTKSDQAPRLLATAIALSVNNITAASTEADKLKAIHTLIDTTSNLTAMETNLILNQLTDKILISQAFEAMQFSDPITKAFIKQGTTFSAAKEVFDVKPLKSSPYDPDKRFSDKGNRAKTLSVVFHTVLREKIMATISLMGVRGAFASEQAYGDYVSKLLDNVAKSYNLIIFETMQKLIDSEIKNVITLDATDFDTWDKIFVEINRITGRWALPSNKYNLGFADPTLAAVEDQTQINVVNRENIFILGSPDFINAIEGKVSPVKFSSEYFDIKKYKGFIKTNAPITELTVLADNALDGYFRITETTQQYWAENNETDVFFHYWLVFGAIPWANGVKIKFTEPKYGTVIDTKSI